MSPEADSNSIDAMIEDMMDSGVFKGMTSDDMFDVGTITPIKKAETVCIKTSISLHRNYFTWDSVA